ncbi:MAG: hypothetical protein JNK04_16910, partial [Myxococcales bacterium]|nr:hypothetical protein [Myxococcales bacterium]
MASAPPSATARSDSQVAATGSAAVVDVPALPPPPPADVPAIVAQAEKACGKEAPLPGAWLAISPERPEPSLPLKMFAISVKDAPIVDGIVAVDPSGTASNLQVERRLGPPSAVYAALDQPALGTYKLLAHRGGKVVGCDEVSVAEVRASSTAGAQSIPWQVTRRWHRDMEDLYSAWVEKLFDSAEDETFSFMSLHEITSDPKRNFLYGYLDLDEDLPPPKGLRLEPDCADLPYFTRAYFAFKMGLPFGYSSCSRGGGGQPPRCGDRSSNLDPLDEPVSKRVRRFETFARTRLANGVHSGTGRTPAEDNKTDYYPIKLSALRPGAIYADPYGHILMVQRIARQTPTAAGALFAVDGQPDGTVAKKRFWQGNFLFSLDDPAMGSPGFKRFRPVLVKGDGVGALGNKAINNDVHYGDFSMEQTGIDAAKFYDMMDDVLSPEPLDPERALMQAIIALDEQVRSRVISVENGEKYFRKGGSRIDMPRGPAIFETVGAWEDYSTPSRDLRLLIAIDVVTGFPARVGRRPERFKMRAGATPADVVKALEARLAKELPERKISYIRSDESKFTISLRDVVDRAPALEAAFNPNDCPEARWGAKEGTDEMATCKRRANGDQKKKMDEVRAWFHERKRP